MFHGPISVEEADVDSYLDMEESNMDLLVTATVRIKLLGKTILFNSLVTLIIMLWKLEDGFDCIDLGYGFYAMKFVSDKDCLKVLTESPKKIMDHYLMVQQWRPNFLLKRVEVKSTTMWIHLLGLPIEYFHELFLVSIGKFVGKPIKVDFNLIGFNTMLATRGKFARILVVVDFDKSLLPKVKIRRFTQRIKYESIHVICFSC
ncbi:hypothetical protein Goari_023407 [Gossypium aridum]|uniref:DUF4283 domain-containing protein n=1 Tax=Gossypium aridum TaxID=34290 RepID=A0A7J8X2X5_GOSAI|nr:hypothetical protein [Gossypium aridum]